MRGCVIGATGFIGRRLVDVLISRGTEVVTLSRDVERARRRLPTVVEILPWASSNEPAPRTAFEGLDFVVNLAGEPIAEGAWTPERKRAIRDSRIIGARRLIEGLAGVISRPKILINASAIGYYGSDRGDEELIETSAPGEGFLANVVREWEAEASRAESLGMRVVRVRSGIVLGQGGGALAPMMLPFSLGLGGPFGAGRQWMSWIHIDDEIGIILHSIENAAVSGPINATAPNAVRNSEFASTLGAALKRPSLLPLPPFALRVVMGESSELALANQRVIPHKALQTGYRYVYPTLRPALEQVVARR